MASPVEHVLSAVSAGRLRAAADHMLVCDAWRADAGAVTEKVAGALRDDAVKNAQLRKAAVHTLLRIGMNLAGAESQGLDAAGVKRGLTAVGAALGAVEQVDKATVRGTVDAILADMKSVNAGDSLPALMAEEIAPALTTANAGEAFLAAFGKFVSACVYTRMSREKYAKFGNDYARGLEHLRHVGYVQVSTNPVLAAKAFDEDPGLVEEFRVEAGKHPEWKANGKAHGDAMALRATLIALWPNLEVFRPPANRANNADYMVSFQLNPNIADRAAESLEDAKSAYAQGAAFLTEYDRHLGADKPGAVRPCIVFKVSGGHEAARTITRELNAEGIGTNNTVVYSVAQECQLILDAFEGKARAAKAGKPITRTYETNMGGRFTSHLREIEAERIAEEAEAKAGAAKTAALLLALAEAIKVEPAVREKLAGQPIAKQAETVCAFKYLKSVDQPAFVALAAAAGYGAETVATLEADLRKAGTMVARRVFGLFYAAANRPKWQSWLQKKYGVSADQAKWIHESMDVLPASKRIVEDTLHALGYPNMCHTEFPNHSRAVELASRKAGFQLGDFRDSLLAQYPPEVAQRLARIPDFIAGYELTGELADVMTKEVGIAEAASCGRRGVTPADWPKFGPVMKTSAEFRAAYDKFVEKCVGIAAGK